MRTWQNMEKKTDTPCNELLCKNAGQSIGISEKMHQRLGKPPIKINISLYHYKIYVELVN